jgi:hypothetical protein
MLLPPVSPLTEFAHLQDKSDSYLLEKLLRDLHLHHYSKEKQDIQRSPLLYWKKDLKP